MGVNISGSYGLPRLDLTEAVELGPSDQAFIAGEILPKFDVPREAGNFSAITRESMLERGKVKHADGAAYSRGDIKATDLSFACIERGHEEKVTARQRSLYMNDFDVELHAAQQARNKVLLDIEIDTAALFNDTTWLTSNSDLYTDGDTWSTISSDIIGDVLNAKSKVFSNSGVEANALIISRGTWVNVRKNTAIRAEIAYSTVPTEAVLMDIIAGLFGLEKILVGNAVYHSGGEGLSYTGSSVWGDTRAMVVKLASAGQGLGGGPQLGRSFHWTEAEDGGVVQYDEPQTKSSVFRYTQYQDEVIFDPYLGHRIKID